MDPYIDLQKLRIMGRKPLPPNQSNKNHAYKAYRL
jgi:hypothetical protein